MRITVELLTQLRVAAGGETSRSLEYEEPVTAQEVVRRLAEEHGDAFGSLVLDPEGGLSRTILIAVGGQQVRPDQPRVLEDGDVLVLGTPIAGG